MWLGVNALGKEQMMNALNAGSRVQVGVYPGK
jgi:hypothetical protein